VDYDLVPLFGQSTQQNEGEWKRLANFIYPVEGLPEKMCTTCQTQINWTLAFQQQIYENELTLRVQLVMKNGDGDVKLLETSANDTSCSDVFRTDEIAEENKEFNSTSFAAIEDMPDLEGHFEPTTSNYVLKNENKPTEGYAEDGDMESDDFLTTENENLVVMDRANDEMEIGNDETTETSNNTRQNKPMETTSFRNPVIECNNSNRTSSKSGGDTRFHCRCGKSFSQKRSLATHKKTHDEKFDALLRCSDCGKKFADRSRLSCHVKSIHQGYFYECPVCGNKQKYCHHLVQHIKKVHPGSVAKPIEKCDKQ
jgi:hypothetical protein